MATYLGGEQRFIELAKKHPQVLVSHSNLCMFAAAISICNCELQLKLELEATLHLSYGQGGPEEWLVVDKHMVAINSGARKCNMIGTNSRGFVSQPNKCYQETGS